MTSSDALGLFESFAHDTRKRSRDDRLRLRMRCPFVVSGVDAGTGVSTVVSDRVSDAPGGSLHWSGCDRLRRLGTLLTRLDTSGFERSTHQVLFHRAFEESCARVLYGDAYAIHRAAIDAKNNWTSGKSEVLISTPRRFGKTFAVSQFCACIALSCKQDIVIFSPGRRASRALLVTIHRFIVAAGCEDRLREYNQEQIRVQSMDAGEPSSSIRSFPSKVQTLKGVGGSIVVIEEAAYCEPQLIQEVVVPLLAMRNSVLLCISTLRESTNHYSKFFRMQARDGTPLFRCIQFSLVCDVCARSEHPERCRHKLHELPHWCSASRVETISNMLGDDPDMFMRETLGITADSTNRAFEEKQLQAMRSRPRILLRDTAVIYVAVDPAGGGNSQFAIVSIADTPQGDQAVSDRAPPLRTRRAPARWATNSSPHNKAASSTTHTNRFGSQNSVSLYIFCPNIYTAVRHAVSKLARSPPDGSVQWKNSPSITRPMSS